MLHQFFFSGTRAWFELATLSGTIDEIVGAPSDCDIAGVIGDLIRGRLQRVVLRANDLPDILALFFPLFFLCLLN